MAKKKKTQKQGIQKRKLNKVNQRKEAKRKLAAKQAPQRRPSMGKIKKNLKALPGLIFEPELAALGFDGPALAKAEAAAAIEPEQIEAAAAGDYLERLTAALKLLDVRFAKEGNADKRMMTQAMIYFMEQAHTPPCMNQLVVALYLNSKHRQETGEDFDFTTLDQALKAYDLTHEAFLEAKSKEMEAAQAGATGAGTQAEEEDEADDLEGDETPEAFADLLSEIEDWAQSVESDTDGQERLVEDLSTLFGDYATEKGWTQLSDLEPKKVQAFLVWFERNLNPTQADLKLMKGSLARFFSGSLAQAHWGEAVCASTLALV